MEQLLSIKHIPIKIEVNVKSAEFKQKDTPSAKISKQNNGVRISAQPCTIDISAERNFDTYVAQPVQGDSGLTLTYDAVAKMASSEEGASGTVTAASNDLAAQQASRSIEAILSKLPKSKNNRISYNEGTLSINYNIEQASDESNFDFEMLSSGFEFIPGSIDFIISQMPDLEIEYLGEPIYFPRSADPNYKGAVDVLA